MSRKINQYMVNKNHNNMNNISNELTLRHNHVRQSTSAGSEIMASKNRQRTSYYVDSAVIEIKTFEIKNKLGLHARVAAKLVNVSTRYKSKIFFERDGRVVNGKSLLSILTLACPLGSRITIRAEGIDARDAMEDLGKLIEDKFGED